MNWITAAHVRSWPKEFASTWPDRMNIQHWAVLSLELSSLLLSWWSLYHIDHHHNHYGHHHNWYLPPPTISYLVLSIQLVKDVVYWPAEKLDHCKNFFKNIKIERRVYKRKINHNQITCRSIGHQSIRRTCSHSWSWGRIIRKGSIGKWTTDLLFW